ncbi:hypothetical protein Bca101_033104 [Brassica carinata]
MERNELREGPIAIAVDKDKTSCQALKWAVEQYIPRDRTIKLVHVVQRSTVNANGHSTDDELSGKQQNDKGSRQFLPMRCLCMRRNIQSEVVMLEDQDVAKALIEYINQSFISTFLLVDDIPSNVMRWAPDFCTVLVISKGRLSSVRPATRHLPQGLPSPSSGTAPSSPLSNTDEAPSEMSLSREDDVFFEEFSSLGTDSSTVNISDRISTDSSVLSFYDKLGTPNMLEIPRCLDDDDKSNLSIYLNSPSDIKLMDEAEAEKRRLRKELKETMNMYHAACREALMAKEKVAELEIWKKKAGKRLQMAEETAKMAIMKMEKRELEVKPRVEAEMKVRGSNDRKVVLDSPGESHMVTILFLAIGVGR